jgi:putative FmdB family regulatory protein
VPTYQYACTACDHQLEAVQSFSDDPLTRCPVCEGRLRKLFGSVGIVFKGPGFYRTDSRAGSNGRSGGDRGSAEAGKGADGNGSGEGSSEKKTGSPAKDSTPVAAGSSGSSGSSGSGGSAGSSGSSAD